MTFELLTIAALIGLWTMNYRLRLRIDRMVAGIRTARRLASIPPQRALPRPQRRNRELMALLDD